MLQISCELVAVFVVGVEEGTERVAEQGHVVEIMVGPGSIGRARDHSANSAKGSSRSYSVIPFAFTFALEMRAGGRVQAWRRRQVGGLNGRLENRSMLRPSAGRRGIAVAPGVGAKVSVFDGAQVEVEIY